MRIVNTIFHLICFSFGFTLGFAIQSFKIGFEYGKKYANIEDFGL